MKKIHKNMYIWIFAVTLSGMFAGPDLSDLSNYMLCAFSAIFAFIGGVYWYKWNNEQGKGKNDEKQIGF
jgi:hypothetical protein